MIVFSKIWLPSYATSRASDLTGRYEKPDTRNLDKYLKRTKDGRRLAKLIVVSNLGFSVATITMMFAWRDVFPMCTLVFSSIFALSWAIALFDLSYRFLTCHYCFNSVADDDLIADDEHDPQGIVYCVDGYRELESELASAATARKGAENESGCDTDECSDSGYVIMDDARDRAVKSAANAQEADEVTPEKEAIDPESPDVPTTNDESVVLTIQPVKLD